jgi:ABC-2 type transport system permease protein
MQGKWLMRNVWTKTLYDKRAFIIGWSLGLMALGFLMIIFYPAFHQDNGLDQLVKSLPPAFQSIVGNLSNLKQLPSYIGSQLYDVRIPIFVSIFAIILSVSLTVAEEEKGQLRTLTALPLSRSRILWHKWLAIVMICLILSIATVVGIEIGLSVINETLDWLVLLRLTAMMWLLAVCLATIVFSIGLASGKRGLTMGIGVLLAAGSFILTTFAMSVEWLQPYERLSLLHYFPAVDVATSGIELRDVIVYVGLIGLFLLVGIMNFRRRDIQ